ncbi:relaxase/mobilization nuclease domain-containing protein [Collinsella vaginalis]|uniref:relaxase/mobilization nuclease domain-containing protein n=1 Tax=Collinsella vaginalis TaxID=1870987 RepID=UPI000A26772D|nr:relaxase/mobilization nuclease domain-containing protein [Collinsella vaginalis]
MATTYIHPLKDAKASMIYTELGNGKKKKMHEVEGTTRAAYEVGDMPRDDMAIYAEEMHKRHPASRYEAFEVRVSFSPDELKAGNKSDEQMAGEHSYKLCKKLYPNSMCYVTVHNDGKGGCVHAHCLVVNHDEVTGQTLRDNRRHFEVKNASDELAAEEGLSVIGTPKFEREKHKEGTTWTKRRESCDAFEQRLGDRVQRARDESKSLDEFKHNLSVYGVELMEQKRMGKDGKEHEAWCYKMMDVYGSKPRKRRRKAKLLADDLTKDSIESYYAQKQANKALEDQKPNVVPAEQEKPAEDVTEPIKGNMENKATYSLLDGYKVDSKDVENFTDDLASQYRIRAIREGRNLKRDADYAQIKLAQQTPNKTAQSLQADMDEARAQFKANKANLDGLKHQKAPSLYGLRLCFKMASQKKSKTAFERMLDDMFAQMMAALVRQMIEEQKMQALEEAEQSLYESRKNMWDAEKRLKAANRAIDHEASRTSGRRVTSQIQGVYDAEKANQKPDDVQFE